MRKRAHNYTPEEKVFILKRHLVKRIPVSALCNEYQLQPKVLYGWRKQFFENGTAAFGSDERSERSKMAKQTQQVEENCKSRRDIISQFMAEHIKLTNEYRRF